MMKNHHTTLTDVAAKCELTPSILPFYSTVLFVHRRCLFSNPLKWLELDSAHLGASGDSQAPRLNICRTHHRINNSEKQIFTFTLYF